MRKNGVLVLIAHPDDETLTFSTRCAGATVVSATDGNWRGRKEERADEFARACDILGAKESRILDIPDLYPWGLPQELLTDRLSSLGGFDVVYTHSPQDDHPHHRSVSLAAAQVFGRIRVQALSAHPMETHVLTGEELNQKMEILNSIYGHEISPADDSYILAAEKLLPIESFAEISYREALQSRVLNCLEVRSELPDLWGFETSPYEIGRIRTTCRVLNEIPPEPIGRIVEIGACEGAMTAALRESFPGTFICAVEPHPVFAERLRERFRGDERLDVREESVFQADLRADVVIMAELLYYLPDHVQDILERVSSRWLLTSCRGGFDARLCRLLSFMGWSEAAGASIPPRYERIGDGSPIMTLRVGTRIRLWRREMAG